MLFGDGAELVIPCSSCCLVFRCIQCWSALFGSDAWHFGRPTASTQARLNDTTVTTCHLGDDQQRVKTPLSLNLGWESCFGQKMNWKRLFREGSKLNGFWRAGQLYDTYLWLYDMRIYTCIYSVRHIHTCRHRMTFVLTRLKVNSRLPSNVEEELVTLAMEQVEAEKCQAVRWWRSDFEILSGDVPRHVAEDCRSSLWFGARWFGWVVWCCNAAVARNYDQKVSAILTLHEFAPPGLDNDGMIVSVFTQNKAASCTFKEPWNHEFLK